MLAKHKQSSIIDISLFAVIFLGFYLFCLGSYPLFTPDEARYSGAARAMLISRDFITPHVNGIPFLDKPILYYWLQAAAMSVFGVNEWAIRLFPVLIGLIGCIVTYLTGRLLFNRETGLVAATILATTPLYFGGAHYANLDLEVAVWISSALLCTITAIQVDNRRRWFMYAAYFFAGLAALTKGLIGLVFPIMITGLWILFTGRWNTLRKLHIIAGIIIIAAITVPWYLAAHKANPDFLHYFFVTQQFSRFVSAGEYNNKAVIWFYVPVILAGFFPWVIFLITALINTVKQCLREKQKYSSELFLLIWAAVVLVFFSIPHSKLVGYILPILPALALLTGRYIVTIWDTTDRLRIFQYALTLGFLCIILGLSLAVSPKFIASDILFNARYLLLALGNILIAGGILLLVTMRYIDIKKLTLFCAALSMVCLLTIVANANKLNLNSAKRLVVMLRHSVKPTDQVFNYYKFYQDVPVYLNRKIPIIADWQAPDIATRDNWMREMWLGRFAPEAPQILLTEDHFWEQWHSEAQVFVFVNANYLEQFKKQAKYYYIIDHENDIYLLSNHMAHYVSRNYQNSLI